MRGSSYEVLLPMPLQPLLHLSEVQTQGQEEGDCDRLSGGLGALPVGSPLMVVKEPRSYHGYHTRRTPSGFTVVTLDYWADPLKTEEWAQGKRLVMGDRAFRREFLRDWTSAAGDSFYPEFMEHPGPETYIRACPGLISGPIYRGWDFGFRHPACVWFQVSKSGRVWVMREFMPDNVDIYTNTELVMWLSGQIQYADLGRHSKRWADIVNSPKSLRAGTPEAPWFEMEGVTPLRFVDLGGPEANQVQANVGPERRERTAALILESKGVLLEISSASLPHRETVIRRLLRIKPDGLPSIFFDPSCRVLVEGFRGGIAYPKETVANPVPDEPHKDGYYDHLHDALGYGLSAVVPAAEFMAQGMNTPAPGSPQEIIWRQYGYDGPPKRRAGQGGAEDEPQEDLGLYETRDPLWE